jgi:hypothetical protein
VVRSKTSKSRTIFLLKKRATWIVLSIMESPLGLRPLLIAAL